MSNIKYANAYKELIEILKYLPKEEYDKLPQEIVNKFYKEANYYYDFEYNPEKSIQDQHVSEISQAIIGVLYRDYWASEEEKNEILKNEQIEYSQSEEKKRKLYNPDNIFKK